MTEEKISYTFLKKNPTLVRKKQPKKSHRK